MRRYTLEWYLSRRRTAPIKDITAFAVSKVMTNYFLYNGDKKHKTGVCTACKNEIVPEKAYKGRYTICPNCGARIKAVDENEQTGSNFQNIFVGYLENYGEYLLHRIFRITREIYPDGKQETHIEEAQMQVLGLPLRKRYTYSMEFSLETCYKNDNGFTRFAETKGCAHIEHWERGVLGGYGSNVFQFTYWTYPYNLKAELKGTPFEYSQIWELAESCEKFRLRSALLKYVYAPQLEYIIKLKLYKLATGFIRFGMFCDTNENNIIKFLRLKSYKDLKLAIEKNMNMAEFEAYRDLLRKNIPYTPKNVQIYKALSWHGSRAEEAAKVISFDGVYDYYKTQMSHRKVSFRTFVGDYADHIVDLKKLQLDLNDTMYTKPKNFYELHARLSAEVTALESKERWDRCDKQLAKEKCYEYKSGGLSVIVPSRAQEIIAEGKVQNHCVGTYIDSVSDGRSVIVFIRKANEPDVSYYTMEISPKTMTVIQCRGYKNCDMTAEVKAFVDEYKTKCLAKLKRELERKNQKPSAEIQVAV